MTFNLEYQSKRQDVLYTLTVTTDDSGELGIGLTGADPDGTVVAEGILRLPPGGATETAKLLRESLDAISGFEGRRTRRKTGNSHQPWTIEQDTTLREAWLSHPPSTQAPELIRELAEDRARTPAAIRARLPRVGCDPDVPGRLLTKESAALVGRDAIATTA
ncbi:hypothetical protein V5P93_000202 [Actinokineospora auranticolor]|uniref:Uncharacterized protein n=1 Tax=Actinokineospora auranticolor TaxID=155976 RepID=A0A2S6GL18_9PSEU|nr:hypothetical protein [Actinokineospora auranticolor]PPK65905.1 hypothetical protein CLV40_112170 [Actinokineospora auranticolor]